MKTQPDEELEAKYGPNWAAVVEVLRAAGSMTDEQREELAVRAAAWNLDRNVAQAAARNADRNVAWTAAPVAAWGAAWDVAWDSDLGTMGHVAWGIARRATCDAAIAAVMKDLIGQHSFTQVHYDTLMAPWIAVFGDPFATPPEA